MNLRFEPLSDRILVTVLTEDQEMNGVRLPGVAKDDMLAGIVIDCGPDVEHVKAKDHITFGPYAGIPLRIEGVPFLLLREGEIMGKVIRPC